MLAPARGRCCRPFSGRRRHRAKTKNITPTYSRRVAGSGGGMREKTSGEWIDDREVPRSRPVPAPVAGAARVASDVVQRAVRTPP
jgi:hypothetical protein